MWFQWTDQRDYIDEVWGCGKVTCFFLTLSLIFFIFLVILNTLPFTSNACIWSCFSGRRHAFRHNQHDGAARWLCARTHSASPILTRTGRAIGSLEERVWRPVHQWFSGRRVRLPHLRLKSRPVRVRRPLLQHHSPANRISGPLGVRVPASVRFSLSMLITIRYMICDVKQNCFALPNQLIR